MRVPPFALDRFADESHVCPGRELPSPVPSAPSFISSHHIWLRDHCRCAECYHPKTKQRLVNTFSVSVDTARGGSPTELGRCAPRPGQPHALGIRRDMLHGACREVFWLTPYSLLAPGSLFRRAMSRYRPMSTLRGSRARLKGYK